MNAKTMKTLAACLSAGIAILTPAAQAQTGDFPTKTLRIIVPFASGSGSDANARYYAEKMSTLLGQPVIVENRAGADGAIGMMAAKSAPADGYTLVQGGISPSVVNAVVIPNLGYDPVKDFTPILGYSRNMNVLLVANESRFKTFADLLAEAKNPAAPLSVGTFSTTLSLTAAWLSSLSKVKLTNIPYKGQSQVMTDVIGNQLDLALVDLGGASTLLRDKKVRALAVTGETRSPDFPQVPTVRESGLPDYVQYSWNALFVRSEVPAPIRDKLANAVRQVMTAPDTIEKFHGPRGTEARPLPSAQVQALQREEIARFQTIAKTIGPVAR